MQYLLSVIHDSASLATPSEVAAIDVFNERLQAEGHWVFAAGLGAPSTATVIDNRGGEAVFTDGPFVESKEYLAGFWIIEAARPRRGAQARRRGVEGLQSEGRGAATAPRVSASISGGDPRIDVPAVSDSHSGVRREGERRPGDGGQATRGDDPR